MINDEDNFIIKNPLQSSLPFFYNYVRCVKNNENLTLVDNSYRSKAVDRTKNNVKPYPPRIILYNLEDEK